MAAQIKKHTETQLSGLYAYHQNKECPSCGCHKYKVLESRKMVEGVRRRYKCEGCGYRDTLYEISSASYEELRSLRAKFALIRNAVLDAPYEPTSPAEETPVAKAPQIPCPECEHFTANSCSFDLPEADTEEAVGCNLFKALVC